MLSFSGKPVIMGILNVTPDSFSDGGSYTEVGKAIQQARRMLSEGADILDIGGESTRPGSVPVSAEEQIRRVLPVIKAIRTQLSETVMISIDTTLGEVAAAAVDAGANIINDVSAGADDAEIFSVAAKTKAGLVLMHRQGTPATMQENPSYQDVVAEVLAGLTQSIGQALSAGVEKDRLIIDPGIGFGKRKIDNLDLLANLNALVTTGYPVLLGASRKRFMGSICAVENPAELVTATAVTTALGVMAGVQIFRVHDVRENRQAADVAYAIKQRQRE